jgi:hypothetical protein
MKPRTLIKIAKGLGRSNEYFLSESNKNSELALARTLTVQVDLDPAMRLSDEEFGNLEIAVDNIVKAAISVALQFRTPSITKDT